MFLDDKNRRKNVNTLIGDAILFLGHPYICDMLLRAHYEHMHILGMCQIRHVNDASSMPRSRLFSFRQACSRDFTELLSVLWYRWRLKVVGSSLCTGLLITENFH